MLSQLKQQSSTTYKARLQKLLCNVLGVGSHLQFRTKTTSDLKQHVEEFKRRWKKRREKEGHMIASSVRTVFKAMVKEAAEDMYAFVFCRMRSAQVM